MSDRSRLTDRKHHLPDLALESEAGERSLLGPGRSLLVVHVHDEDCAAYRSYIDELGRSVDEITSWGGDVAVVVAAKRPAAPEAFSPAFRTYYDPDEKLERALDTRCPGVLVADQWGDIVLMQSAGATHEFPGIERLISEIRYLGIRCPECEGEAL